MARSRINAARKRELEGVPITSAMGPTAAHSGWEWEEMESKNMRRSTNPSAGRGGKKKVPSSGNLTDDEVGRGG